MKLNDAQEMLIRFATKTNALDLNEKLKLILFTSGIKPVTYIILKVFPKKPEEAVNFERLLKQAGFVFRKSRPKTFEEITSIKKNEIRWDIKGVWIGYDLFHTKKQLEDFKKYLHFAEKGRHTQADRIAGKLYGYPACCIDAFIKKNNNPKSIAKKYSYYDYFKFLHYVDKKFPFIQHQPHALNCRGTINLNKKYRDAVRKYAPEFYKSFIKKKTFKTDVVVDVANDIMAEELLTEEGPSIWPIKNGHDYIFITMNPIVKKYWLINHLVKDFIERGTVFPAKITMQYDMATIELGKPKKQLGELFHERKFPLQRG